jgi:hypothetical protein
MKAEIPVELLPSGANEPAGILGIPAWRKPVWLFLELRYLFLEDTGVDAR